MKIDTSTVHLIWKSQMFILAFGSRHFGTGKALWCLRVYLVKSGISSTEVYEMKDQECRFATESVPFYQT